MRCVIIPARLQSTRLPRKLLLDVRGKPILWHTIQRARESIADAVWVATEDDEICDVVDGFGFPHVRVIKTGVACSGTDRIAQLRETIKQNGVKYIVNLQGDEPTLSSMLINELFNVSKLDRADVVTLATDATYDEYLSKDVTKVVIDNSSQAMYFSRSPIPYGDHKAALRHIGVYAFRPRFLGFIGQDSKYKCESLEQLQWLEHKWQIKVIVHEQLKSISVDTYDDYKRLLCQE